MKIHELLLVIKFVIYCKIRLRKEKKPKKHSNHGEKNSPTLTHTKMRDHFFLSTSKNNTQKMQHNKRANTTKNSPTKTTVSNTVPVFSSMNCYKTESSKQQQKSINKKNKIDWSKPG